MSNTEYSSFTVNVSNSNGIGANCTIRLPVKGNGWDEWDTQERLVELVQRAADMMLANLGADSDWEDVYGDEEE